MYENKSKQKIYHQNPHIIGSPEEDVEIIDSHNAVPTNLAGLSQVPFLKLFQPHPYDQVPIGEKQASHICKLLVHFWVEPVTNSTSSSSIRLNAHRQSDLCFFADLGGNGMYRISSPT